MHFDLHIFFYLAVLRSVSANARVVNSMQRNQLINPQYPLLLVVIYSKRPSSFSAYTTVVHVFKVTTWIRHAFTVFNWLVIKLTSSSKPLVPRKLSQSRRKLKCEFVISTWLKWTKSFLFWKSNRKRSRFRSKIHIGLVKKRVLHFINLIIL